ncbi:MAG: hypothetical protein LUC32_04165 [Clostridiales bacterium]|nr:hypothetical protein [Clostridiales bacterium]
MLRLATVLLAISSWWATAQGMTEYVFGNGWQAKLASFGIQGILLGLNFYLPTFWSYMRRWAVKGCVAVLTCVVLFCSSWFSYVYIVEKAYETAWDSECRILIRSAYREVLYAADDYATEYAEELRDELGTQIVSLYEQAGEAGDGSVSGSTAIGSIFDLEQDRADYADNEDFAANGEMAMAIAAMKSAVSADVTAQELADAQEVISSLQAQVEETIVSLEGIIEQLEASVENAQERIGTAENRLSNAADDADTTLLEEEYDSAKEELERQQGELTTRQAELSDYQTAQQVLGLYAVYLGLDSVSAQNKVTQALLEIQSALLADDTDLSAVEEQVETVFALLQSAVTEGDVTDENAYVSLLDSMDQFYRDIRDYKTLRETEQELEKLIANLSETDIDAEEDWKAVWDQKLDDLQACVGSLPAYTETENESLAAFDRTDFMDDLDNARRLYIVEHNAADNAVIYLIRNPYREMALLSVGLAFLLDLAAFAVGFIIYIVENEDKRKKQEGMQSEDRYLYMNRTMTEMSACRYLYLTGNYTCENGRFYYQAFDGEKPTEAEDENDSLPRGFYIYTGEGETRRLQEVINSSLVLCGMPGGPSDGMYGNCRLRWRDDTLWIQKDGEESFVYLAPAPQDVPVFRMSGERCTVFPALELPENVWERAVVALNENGTKAAAVYLLGAHGGSGETEPDDR